jgi:putative nucleotidyltransferase with HDIG domain
MSTVYSTSRPDYHAILRHQEEVGNEEAPARVRPATELRWPFLVRIGSALAVATLFAVPILLLREPLSERLILLLLINAATALVAVHVGHLVSRREVQSWARALLVRTERVFSGDPSSTRREAGFETYLEELAHGLEVTLERQLQHERNAIIGTITSLVSALETRDPYTRNHSARVAQLAVRVGKEMGLSRSELYELHLGGLLHDIGKIGIPDSILLKPHGLSQEEYEVMKTHTELGARILAGIPGLEAVVDIVLSHHEMYDGCGYPRGLTGATIPLGARIVAVCDTYLSMAEDRPYRHGRTLEDVLGEIRRVAGRQLDPRVVDTLETMLAQEMDAYGRPLAGFGSQEQERERAAA